MLGAKQERSGAKLDFMAYEIFACLTACGVLSYIDYIVPVPMYYSDKLKRGYNHTEKICAELSRLTGIKTLNALKKTKRTNRQKELSRKERLVNLKNSFTVICGEQLKGKSILVIDDVTTTGATFISILESLEKSGCADIAFAAFAKTPQERKEEV